MSDPDAAQVPIVHNPTEQRFEARFPEGIAVLEYHYDPDGRLHLDHTEVPPPLRHQGVAARLVEAALDFAGANNLTVVPVCPYVTAYLEKHPRPEPLADVDRGQGS